MEPSCSVNSNVLADPYSEDPLSAFSSTGTYLVISRPFDESEGGRCFVSLYNPPAGLTYIGTTGTIWS